MDQHRARDHVPGVGMSNEGHDLEPSPVTDSEWQWLSRLASDIVVLVDDNGVCTWVDGAAWQGRALRDQVHADEVSGLAALLAPEPVGPMWLRRRRGDGSVAWWHASSTPHEGGGWVVQLRGFRPVDPMEHASSMKFDVVTGVAGREHALDEVAFLLSATPRTGKEVAVACCGLDRFTELNSALGRDTGDEVLRVVAGRITDALRSGDLVARWEGDRFLVVLRGVHHLRGAIRVANKIRAVVEDPITVNGDEVHQTVSVGVTLISRGESVDSVLERAEGAMQMSKDAGRNLVMSSPPI
jgi:diguanylate cyclase (GGDEF)-like protein